MSKYVTKDQFEEYKGWISRYYEQEIKILHKKIKELKDEIKNHKFYEH